MLSEGFKYFNKIMNFTVPLSKRINLYFKGYNYKKYKIENKGWINSMISVTKFLLGTDYFGDSLRYHHHISKNPHGTSIGHGPVVAWNITQTCNLNCIHCYMNSQNQKYEGELTHKEAIDLIDDLGNKASDILQSNGIIWVEGPSDRLYLNKWINTVSNGQLKEHIHYQIMFYGGRLLSHLTLEEVDKDAQNETLINLLLMNRNSIIIIDSDIKNESQDINATKRRIKDKYDENESICWITYGKEIENYVPKNVIDRVFDLDDNNEFGRYTTIIDYLNNKSDGLGDKFEKNKVKYAKLFLEDMNITEINQVYDLQDKLDSVVNEIKKWNNLI